MIFSDYHPHRECNIYIILLPRPGSGSERTIASEWQKVVLARLHIGPLVTIRLHPKQNKTNIASRYDQSNSDIFIKQFIVGRFLHSNISSEGSM